MESFILLLAGGIIGFVASILKDFFLEKTKKKYKEIELKRNKLEELYIEIDNWFNYYSLNSAMFIQRLEGNSISNSLSEERDKKFVYDLIKIEMIISIYLEILISDYNTILSKWDELNEFQAKNKGSSYKEEYITLNNHFTNQVKNFKMKIVKEIRTL
ncbi:MAG: hypothetical protein ACNI3C_01210 [Candidatus Marinarcus sp.]|uniref:hypothetical protein n=1 Tax=Candidatus Marinarcus sp. TaxID=3100987 RepID=UPI003AFF6C13